MFKGFSFKTLVIPALVLGIRIFEHSIVSPVNEVLYVVFSTLHETWLFDRYVVTLSECRETVIIIEKKDSFAASLSKRTENRGHDDSELTTKYSEICSKFLSMQFCLSNNQLQLNCSTQREHVLWLPQLILLVFESHEVAWWGIIVLACTASWKQ